MPIELIDDTEQSHQALNLLEERHMNFLAADYMRAKWNVPRYSQQYKNDTPEIQFLDDLKTGTKKVEDYLKFINEQLEHAQKYGSLVGLDRVASAAQGLKKITGKLCSGLGKAGKAINRIKQAVEWIHAADAFADVTIAMDPKDRESVKRAQVA